VVAAIFTALFALLFQYRILSLLKKLGADVTPLGTKFPLVLDFQHASQWSLPFLYTVDYLNSVWSATLIGLCIGGAVDAFLPGWIHRRLGGGGFRQHLAGVLFGLPNMLCSCCAVSATAGLRRSGAGRGSALAFFVTAPTLNLVAILLAFQLLPLKLAMARLLLALAAAIGVTFLAARLAPEPVGAAPPPAEARNTEPPGALIRRWLNRTGRLARTVLPTLLAGFLLIGLLRTLVPVETLATTLGNSLPATLLASTVGTVLMIPTFTEVLWVAEFTRHGMGTGPAVALLITLPAVSVPSLWALGRVLNSYKAAAALGLLILALGVVGGTLFGLCG
jgi:hypothetical protein